MLRLIPLFIIIDFLAIISLLIGILTSSLILFIIARKLTHRDPTTNLLLANTCVCTLELCFSFLLIYSYIITNDFRTTHSATNLYDQQILCPIRSYFLFTGFALLYTSYCLQAYYRLRQIIFFRKPNSYRIFVRLCLCQWIFSFLLVLPMPLTRAFVYIPADFFCPIPFTKPLSVAYIAISVYGVFLTIFAVIYLRIYVYASQTTSITVRRRRTIERQVVMLKRILFPTFSLMFLGLVYLALFFQAIGNQYRTHRLTYRLSYLFIAIGMSFIHAITIKQTPPIRNAILDLYICSKIPMWRRRDSVNIAPDNSLASTHSRRNRGEPLSVLESYHTAETADEGTNLNQKNISETGK